MTTEIVDGLRHLEVDDARLVIEFFGLGSEARPLSQLASDRNESPLVARTALATALTQLANTPEMKNAYSYKLEGVRPDSGGYERRCAHVHCRKPILTSQRGRPRQFCSNACRQAAYRTRLGLLGQDGAFAPARHQQLADLASLPATEPGIPLEKFYEAFAADNVYLRADALRRLASTKSLTTEARELIAIVALGDDYISTRTSAIEILAATWPADEEVLQMLSLLARDDPTARIRRSATRQLSTMRIASAATHMMLIELARVDEDDLVRCAALKAATDLFLGRSLTESALLTALEKDISARVRSTSANLLLRQGWPSLNEACRRSVLYSLKQDRSQTVVDTILHGLKDFVFEETVFDLLIRHAESGTPSHAYKIMQLLTEVDTGKQLGRVSPLLRRIAQSASTVGLRIIALKLLRQSQCLEILADMQWVYDLTKEDAEPSVRLGAALLLTQGRSIPIELLQDWIRPPESLELRQQCMKLLSGREERAHENINLLIAAATDDPDSHIRKSALNALQLASESADSTGLIVAAFLHSLRVDSDDAVRLVAWKAAERFLPDQSVLREMLHAVWREPSQYVQRCMLRSLLQQWPKEQLLVILEDNRPESPRKSAPASGNLMLLDSGPPKDNHRASRHLTANRTSRPRITAGFVVIAPRDTTQNLYLPEHILDWDTLPVMFERTAPIVNISVKCKAFKPQEPKFKTLSETVPFTIKFSNSVRDSFEQSNSRQSSKPAWPSHPEYPARPERMSARSRLRAKRTRWPHQIWRSWPR